MKRKSILTLTLNCVNRVITVSAGARSLQILVMLAVISTMSIGGSTTDQVQDIGKMMDAANKVAEEIKGMSLQDAKNTIIKRLSGFSGMTSADLGVSSLQGQTYAVEFYKIKVYGAVVSFKDLKTGHTVWLSGDAQADAAMKAVNAIDLGKTTLQDAKKRIETLKDISGVVFADLNTAGIGGKTYLFRFCLDEKFGGLTVIRDIYSQREVALKTSADADQVMKIVTELKFEGLTLTQAQDLINSRNFDKLGVVYANFGGEKRFPLGEKSDSSCVI